MNHQIKGLPYNETPLYMQSSNFDKAQGVRLSYVATVEHGTCLSSAPKFLLMQRNFSFN